MSSLGYRKRDLCFSYFLTSFSSLSLMPPGSNWGLITKVLDYLELYYNIDLSKIEGFKKALMEP